MVNIDIMFTLVDHQMHSHSPMFPEIAISEHLIVEVD